MLFLAVMGFQALGGQLSGRDAEGMSAAALYWYATIAVYAVHLVRRLHHQVVRPKAVSLRCSPPDPSGSSGWGSSPSSSRPPTAGAPAAPASARSPRATTAASATTSATRCCCRSASSAVFLGFVALAVRDADPSALAQLAGTDEAPAVAPPAHLAYWPVLGALGLTLVVLGLVVSNVLFIAAFILLHRRARRVDGARPGPTGPPATPTTNRIVRDPPHGPLRGPAHRRAPRRRHRRRALPRLPHLLEGGRRVGGHGLRRRGLPRRRW